MNQTYSPLISRPGVGHCENYTCNNVTGYETINESCSGFIDQAGEIGLTPYIEAAACSAVVLDHIAQLLLLFSLDPAHTAAPGAQTTFIMASATKGDRWPRGNEKINEGFRKDFALLKPNTHTFTHTLHSTVA